MNPKPVPMAGPPRARCPVCREVVYSRAGIHPQCAVRQSEAPRTKGKGAAGPVEALDPAEAGAVDQPRVE
jgi:hypothetical protein